MDEKLFAKLIGSASQAAEIVRGDRVPSRTIEVASDIVRERIADTVARLDPAAEEEALRWIEAVSDFDDRHAR